MGFHSGISVRTKRQVLPLFLLLDRPFVWGFVQQEFLSVLVIAPFFKSLERHHKLTSGRVYTNGRCADMGVRLVWNLSVFL